jgi:hemolysin activation/secretion protein
MLVFFYASAALAANPRNAAAPNEPGTAPVHVDRISFRGNRALAVNALRAVATPYLGHDLSPADIENLRSALTHRYTDHGYINSSVVLDPETPYKNGVLRFQVIEGRVREIHVHGVDGRLSTYVVDRLRGRDEEILNTDVLRARLQRLSDDPLFAHVSSSVQPGSEPGDAILDVDVQRGRPYSVAVALNDYRPPPIGEKAYDVSGQVRDLTGFGDLIDAGLSGPIEFSGGIGYGLNWQLPFDRFGDAVSLSAARINTVFSADASSAGEVRSTIDRQELRLIHTFAGSLREQINVSASIADEQESTPGSIEGSARSVTARLIPEYIYRSEQQYLNVRFTLLHADLLDYPSGPLPNSFPERNYFVWSGQLHHLWELARSPFELESRAIVQRTNSQISDLHALGIGGINSVRGFREDELIAADVENVNVDFRWHAVPADTSQRPGVTLGTFFDWAAGHDVGAPIDTFSSYGVTVRLKWPHVQGDLAYGLRLIHPSFVNAEHGSWQDHGIHVQISTTY